MTAEERLKELMGDGEEAIEYNKVTHQLLEEGRKLVALPKHHQNWNGLIDKVVGAHRLNS